VRSASRGSTPPTARMDDGGPETQSRATQASRLL
jgi:hypothetical protein